jgi:hypothetical protein
VLLQTVPAGKPLDLSGLAKGTVVNIKGKLAILSSSCPFRMPPSLSWLAWSDFSLACDLTGTITFAHSNWDGPLFVINGEDVTFEGNGQIFDGSVQEYWDGQGSNGGVTKPKMMKISVAGTFQNVVVKNSPEQVRLHLPFLALALIRPAYLGAWRWPQLVLPVLLFQAFSIGFNKAPLTIDSVTVDNKAGDALGDDGKVSSLLLVSPSFVHGNFTELVWFLRATKAIGHNSDC